MIIVGTHDTFLVALSILIAVLASYTALDLAGRVRASVGVARRAWLATAALAMGGGIWAMHFVAMLAFSMPGMEVGYDIGLTIQSLFVAVGATGIGFLVMTRATQARPMVLLTSGILMGVGIAAMHYLGMAAMRMQADLSFDHLWATVSVLIAIGAATVALWLTVRTSQLIERIGAAVVMGIAVAGMHYAAMRGSVFRMRPGIDMGHGYASIGQAKLAIAVFAATFLILLMALVAALLDRRYAGTLVRLQDDLRTAYDRQALMLRLVERMRVLDEPSAIMLEISEALAEYLQIDRAGFYRVVQDAAIAFDPDESWTTGRLPRLTDTMPIAVLGEAMIKRTRANETIACSDARRDKEYAAFLQIDTVAIVSVPLTREGQWKAGFYCNHTQAREWAPQEVRLIEELVAMAWDAVERAEARQQLRQVNQQLEARVEEQTREMRRVADALPVLIAFIDKTLTYRFANLACLDWLYVSPQGCSTLFT